MLLSQRFARHIAVALRPASALESTAPVDRLRGILGSILHLEPPGSLASVERGFRTSVAPRRRPTSGSKERKKKKKEAKETEGNGERRHKKKQRWTYSPIEPPKDKDSFDVFATSESSKHPQQPRRRKRKVDFDVDAESLPQLPHFSALIASESVKLRGEKGLSQVLDKDAKLHINGLLKEFCNSGSASDKSLELYVNAELWPQASSRFRRFILRAITPEVRDHLLAHSKYSSRVEKMLFPYFAQFTVHEFSPEIQAYRAIVNSADLRRPHEWYKVSRSIQRKIIYHAGPTNSGKTYNALQAFKAAEIGLYCGPLRLLAMEVYDSSNLDGVRCNLVTGQENRQVPEATHTSCTVEMISCSKRVDVCVIDEIQLLGDESRGQSWTRALQGVPANEIHLCGDASAVPLVRQLCRQMGEALEVKHYKRFTPLTVDQEGLPNGYKDVRPGDCIVAFSRRDIFDIKRIVEEESGLKTCVVYGALPPETRRQQARLFNDPDSGYDILVASDAVGMGLNLNIRRVIFHTMFKFEGLSMQQITASQIKQIGGRAGRRNSIYPEGFVTCFESQHMPILQEALDLPQSAMRTPEAGLFPEFEQIEMFASKVPGDDMCKLLQQLMTEAKLDGIFFFCKQESLMTIAKLLQKLPELSLRERFTFALAPVNVRDPRVLSALLEFATVYARGYPVCCKLDIPTKIPSTDDELKHLETLHQVVSLWIWLSMRFEERFPGRESAEVVLAKVIRVMDLGLENLSRINEGDSEAFSFGGKADLSDLTHKAAIAQLMTELPLQKHVRMKLPLGVTMGRRKLEHFAAS